MEGKQLQKRLIVYGAVVVALLLLLVMRLAIVQIVYGDDYQIQAQDNLIRLSTIPASRGEIYDRNGVVLAANELVYTVALSYTGISQPESVADDLALLLSDYYPDISADTIQGLIDAQRLNNRLFEPVVIARDIPWDLVTRLEERRAELPGVGIEITPLRSYPQQSLAGHVLGYIHSITQEEIEASTLSYSLDSLIGKSGLEKYYEEYLKGNDGATRVEADAVGRPINELVTMDPTPGDNLHLTLDVELQRAMEESIQRVMDDLERKYPLAKVGSAVLLDAHTGATLAMASLPNLYPDDFKGNLSAARAGYYYPQGDYDPLAPGAGTNRAIQSTYPPGSTFKPVTGIAALHSGQARASDVVTCTGAYWVAPYIKCTGVHGKQNYFSGMAHSCNVYFQEMGRRATEEWMVWAGRQLGLGQRTGVDLPYEAAGNLPHAEWKALSNGALIDYLYSQRRQEIEDRYEDLMDAAETEEEYDRLEQRKKKELAQMEAQYQIDYGFETAWQSFDTFNMSIGQGANSYSALALARYVAAVCNGGYLVTPYLVEDIVDAGGNAVPFDGPEQPLRTEISDEALELTCRAMVQTTQSGGTAAHLFTHFPPEVPVAAKTGTAETGRTGDKENKQYHGVFVAFAPADDPQVVFAGIMEYGNSGSGSMGYVARDVFESYFGIDPAPVYAAPAVTPPEEAAEQDGAAPEDTDTQAASAEVRP
ncbi:MAG: penicillin-binding transpeptidase domain-containing protein [Syntrophomonadaceae bacterium]|nr:penicillin-binding transpeptidase domain-containing protein [Syntrophomonadaceae bacterium]